METVIETAVFTAKARKAGVSDVELRGIVEMLSDDPTCGDLIQGTGGARKVRFAKQDAGKSGGYRVIHFYAGGGVPVFLLDIYGKGQKANLTQAEKNELRGLLAKIAVVYRASTKARAQKLETK